MASSLKDLYAKGRKEISMRDELEATFDGTALEISKKQPCLIRRMRLDSAGKKIPCVCVDPTTKEAEKDRLCPICLAEGFIWDEIDADMYKVLLNPREVLQPSGLSNTPTVIFYMRYSTDVLRHDKVIELVLDIEGNPVQPRQRRNVFRIQHIEIFRLDDARVEYLKLFTFKEDVKHLNVS
jgi:hypothetical protein